ncbi:transporter substrate-binding domain-containing protein [Candidatus Stoquefichus massiliensis]|uniref:transporter substrate-binding domain-containing protein n=1 Tax=Candidatus Stoquefichus massiliensis TaxID=1470350 RepID=UPI00047FB8FB|nr:transporter substrate-binding domain-containing protein [Candidatus Stoquefichus massiliensis]
MKKLLKVMLVVMMAVMVSACGSKDTANDDKKETKLLIGISPDYPPYESLNNKNEMEGFDIDMTKELIDIMNANGGNYTYEFKQMSFDTIRQAVESDQIDLGISGFTMHKEWTNVDWSHKYNDSKQVALIASDSDIKTAADLEGKKIGAQLSATGETCAKEIKNADVKAVTDVKVLVETLRTGGVDAVILDYAVAKNYVENAGFKMLDETLLEEENLIITKKGNTELMNDVNKALDSFVGSDKYNELKEKWGA